MGSWMVLGREGGREGAVGGAVVLRQDQVDMSIEDSGFGVTRNELMNNFGTIAMSGTKALEAMSAGGVFSLIGQFGVCFLPDYLVSDKIRVVSKRLKTNSTPGSPQPVSLSPCRTTPRWCTGWSSVTRRSLFT